MIEDLYGLRSEIGGVVGLPRVRIRGPGYAIAFSRHREAARSIRILCWTKSVRILLFYSEILFTLLFVSLISVVKGVKCKM